MTSDAVSSPGPARTGRGWATPYSAIVVVTILAAVLLRFVALDRYPLPLHQDELSNIYDGYSIATTGADRAGARWPILLRAMGPGDYRPALYAYLAAGTTWAWGFSVWAGRIPAAVLGVLTVVLVFALGRRLMGKSGGLVALLFAAFSPILIQYGRQAHEGACLPPFFAILTVYLLYRALESFGRRTGSYACDTGRRANLFWLAGAGLSIGLSTSAYGAQRLTGPLFVLLGCTLIVWLVGWIRRTPRRAGVALLVFALAAGIGAIPQIYAMFDQPEQFFARARSVGYDWRYGPRWWGETLIAGYAAHFNAHQLFFSVGDYQHLTVSRLSVAALPFLYIGLAVVVCRIIARRQPVDLLLLGAVMICILPAVASKGDPSIIRASGVWGLYPIVCALGAVGAGSIIRSGWRRLATPASARLATAGLSAAIVAFGVYNIYDYLAHPEWHDATGQNHLVEIGNWLREHGEGYERVYIESPGYFPHLYAAAFTGMHPAEFQRSLRESAITPTGWETVQRFGRYHLTDLSQARADWAASDHDESWLYVDADGDMLTFNSDGVERHHHALALAPRFDRTRHP